MRMAVPQRRVLVVVRVRLDPVPVEIMLVAVVLVVAVLVRVIQRRVLVLMGVRFGQMQPDAAPISAAAIQNSAPGTSPSINSDNAAPANGAAEK